MGITDVRGLLRPPKIKTLNHQIDVIEASSTATEARLAKIEKILERIAGELEKKARYTDIRAGGARRPSCAVAQTT